MLSGNCAGNVYIKNRYYGNCFTSSYRGKQNIKKQLAYLNKMLNSVPKRSGIYYLKDNINNLQFKIQFRAINTLLRLPKYTLPEYNEANAASREIAESSAAAEDEKTVVIKWQQKIFSADECELYGDLKNCTSEQQKKYHAWLKEAAGERKPSKKRRQRKQAKSEKGHFLFTYVHEDNFHDPNEAVDETRGKRLQLVQEAEPFEQMFVYADLKPHIQLLALRWHKHERILYIYPDFTDYQNQPYYIEIDSDYRHLYAYGIEDVSLKALPVRGEYEQFVYLPELPAHWRFEEELNKKFHMPPRNTQRCAIIFSINSAKNFEYDNIHVRYCIKLPAHTILEEGLLQATSHSAAKSSMPTADAVHIGLTWQITVLCEEQFDPSQYLRIFFEVISIDCWERERLEGVAHISLHFFKPDQATVELNCIRPCETILESINRFFIGGRRKFDYVNFICKHNVDGEQEVGGGFACRYGQRLQNSGQLNFSYQMLTQRNCELLNPCANRTSGMTLDDIMMAYKEARRRLEAVSLI